MDAKKDFPLHNPGQIARRRQGSLDLSEGKPRKRRPLGGMKATKLAASSQPVTNSVKSGDILQNELKIPRRHAKMGNQVSEGPKSVPRMDELHPKLRESLGLGRDYQNKLSSQSHQAPQSHLPNPGAPERNVIGLPMRERILQIAQESLLKMIDEGDSELVIANQVDVVEKLRARMKHIETPETIAGPVTAVRNRNDSKDRIKRPLQKTRGPGTTSTSSLFISPVDTADVVTIASSPEPQLGPDSDSSSNSPVKKKSKYGSTAKKQARKGAQNQYEAATMRTAFPADKPTSLPHRYRIKKILSPTAIFKESQVHVTFDPAKTNQFDRHARKINTTNAAARGKKMAARNLQDSIGYGGLTDSDEATPQARIDESNIADGKEDKPQTFFDASKKDVFRDFDLMDEEADLLSDDDSIFHEASPSERQKILG